MIMEQEQTNTNQSITGLETSNNQNSQGNQNKQDQQPDVMSLVAQTLNNIKQQLPQLQQMKQQAPDAYQSVIGLIQALVTVAQQLSETRETTTKAESPDFEIGLKEETKEHPEFTPEQIAQIVRDHLKENPNYYTKKREPALNKSVKSEAPINATIDGKTKVMHSDGSIHWVGVRNGMLMDANGDLVGIK
jgi:hypothetical protein